MVWCQTFVLEGQECNFGSSGAHNKRKRKREERKEREGKEGERKKEKEEKGMGMGERFKSLSVVTIKVVK
jgi:hypothetical protein